MEYHAVPPPKNSFPFAYDVRLLVAIVLSEDHSHGQQKHKDTRKVQDDLHRRITSHRCDGLKTRGSSTKISNSMYSHHMMEHRATAAGILWPQPLL